MGKIKFPPKSIHALLLTLRDHGKGELWVASMTQFSQLHLSAMRYRNEAF